MKNAKINPQDVYRYLGFGRTTPDEKTLEQIAEIEEILSRISQPRGVYQRFSISLQEESVDLDECTLSLTGDNAKLLLAESHHCYLMSVTVGQAVDQEIRMMQLKDMAKAVILDACASSLVEEVCNALEKEILESLENEFLTDRFSPGYGDLPLSLQGTFCQVLQTQKKIGLSASKNWVMSPKKSITAVLGVADQPQAMRIKGCAYCSLRKNCAYRKGGKTCGT